MNLQLTEHDGRTALRDHLLAKAAAARAKYGPIIDADAIMRVMDDREIVRYPVGIRYDASGLQPGEFAHAVPLGDHPRLGFCLFIHPSFQAQHDLKPLLIAYHLPPVSYGDIASPEDCEVFGAALLGLDVEDYYNTLCAAADSLGTATPETRTHS